MALQKPASIIPALSPLSVTRMLWKRGVLIVLVWAAVTMAGVAWVRRIPSIYKADALVLVDSQKIPDRYVSSTVVSDTQDLLATISLEILSNGRLQKIIDDFDLYREQRRQHPVDSILEMMRRDIVVVPEKAWTGRTSSFRVSYQGPDPVVVARVTNRIADLYVQENIRTRKVQAEGTSEFIDSQLKEAKQKLDQVEAAVSQYKTRHNGELPQQEVSLNATLNRLQVQLEANRDALNRGQESKITLQNEIDIAEDAASAQAKQAKEAQAAAAAAASLALALSAAPAVPGVPLSRPLKKSEELQARLNEMRLHYSDAYPDVKRLRAQLAQARQEEAAQGPAPTEAAQGPAPAGAAPGAAGSKTGASQRPRPVLDSPELIQARARIASLKSQLALANEDIQNREKEQREILGEIAFYQGKVSALPIREQEMAQITRDYEFSKANYRSLLDKKINAAMATDMEVRQESEKFTVADPARVPTKPFKPRRMLLNAGGAVLGLLLGLAVGFGRELQQGALLGEWELPAGVPVLGRLPYIDIVAGASPPGGSEEGASGGRRLKALIVGSISVAAIAALGFYFIFIVHRF